MTNKLTLITSLYCYDTMKKKYELEVEINMENTGHSFSYELLNNWLRETIDNKSAMPEEVAELVLHHLDKFIQRDMPITVVVRTIRNPHHHINVEYVLNR